MKDNQDFLSWCLTQKPLIQLAAKDFFSFNELVAARNRILDDGHMYDVALHNSLAELFTLRRIRAHDEFNMYPPIAQALNGVIKGGASQPDCLVGNVPVEAKKTTFNKSALKQLQRYMKQTGSVKGIAAAPKLDTDLPKNIFFLKVTFDIAQLAYVVRNAEDAISWLKTEKQIPET